MKSANHGGKVALKTFVSPEAVIKGDSVVVVVVEVLVVVVGGGGVVVVVVVVVVGRFVVVVVVDVVEDFVDVGIENEENRGLLVVDSSKDEGSLSGAISVNGASGAVKPNVTVFLTSFKSAGIS